MIVHSCCPSGFDKSSPFPPKCSRSRTWELHSDLEAIRQIRVVGFKSPVFRKLDRGVAFQNKTCQPFSFSSLETSIEISQ